MNNKSQKYHLVCGMETHVELGTKSKMFCGCKNDPFHAKKPNIYTCPVCLGMPGGLPVANRQAIEWTIKLGLALNCKINLFSKFDRKHYFYPDLPKGYQISQYDIPFCTDGYLETSEGRVNITRIHLEEDTGKLLHKTINGKKVSLIDYNRSGVPLVEIVSEPDIKSGHQASEYSRTLRKIIRYLEISDCDMEQGGMRLEANVSVAANHSDANNNLNKLPNYKVELKNINSFRFLEQAIAYEVERQSKILDTNQTPIQETRGYNPKTGETFSQRIKEEAADYRYFPDPDLPPIRFKKDEIERLQASLPEMPDQVAIRWEEKYQINQSFSNLLLKSASQTQWLEKVWQEAQIQQLEPVVLAKQLAQKKLTFDLQKFATDHVKAAKELVEKFVKSNTKQQLSNSELKQLVDQTMAENPKEKERFLAGDKKLMGFFIGQIKQKITAEAKTNPKIDVKQIQRYLAQL